MKPIRTILVLDCFLGFDKLFSQIMNTILSVLLLFCMISLEAQNRSSDKSEQQYRIEKMQSTQIAKNVMLVSGGEQFTNQIAIKTSEGIIIVDSGDTPEYGQELRQKIYSCFNDDRFIYIIYTHHHLDHTGGNSAFPDAQIVAHSNFHIFLDVEDETENPSNNDNPAPVMKNDSMLPPPPPPPLSNQPYTTISNSIGEDKFEYISPVPDIVFSDELILNFESLTICIYYYGISHTDNDIIIYIPEEEVLAVGDLFYKDQLPPFSKRSRLQPQRWISILEEVLDSSTDSITIIPGHFATFEKNDLLSYKNYIKHLYGKVRDAIKKEQELPEVIDEMRSLDSMPGLISKDVKDNMGNSLHIQNIIAIWNSIIQDDS